jgi:glutathione S-transferase
MYKLYERPNGGNFVVECVLTELGQPYEMIRVPRNPDKTIPSWFFEINPRGEVPVLVLPDGTVMAQSAAIIIHLADLGSNGQLSPDFDDPARPRYLQWILFFATAAYNAEMRIAYPQNFTAEASGHAGVSARAIEEMQQARAIFAKALGDGPFILGATFSAADIYAAMLLCWSPTFEADMKQYPTLGHLVRLVSQRPGLAAVFTRNNMPVPPTTD